MHTNNSSVCICGSKYLLQLLTVHIMSG